LQLVVVVARKLQSTEAQAVAAAAVLIICLAVELQTNPVIQIGRLMATLGLLEQMLLQILEQVEVVVPAQQDQQVLVLQEAQVEQEQHLL